MNADKAKKERYDLRSNSGKEFEKLQIKMEAAERPKLWIQYARQ